MAAYPPITPEIAAVEIILSQYRQALGADYGAYRNHI